jgi:hypothetical protein
MRLGSPLKNHTWLTGVASVMWPEALAADLRLRDLDTALVADHAAMLHALVLAAQAFPVGDRTEDLGAEQAVPFRLERPVVDGLRLGDLAVRPRENFVRRREADTDRVEIGRQRAPAVKRWSHVCLSGRAGV